MLGSLRFTKHLQQFIGFFLHISSTWGILIVFNPKTIAIGGKDVFMQILRYYAKEQR